VCVRACVHFAPSEGENRIGGQEWNLSQVFKAVVVQMVAIFIIFHCKQQMCERVTSLEPHLS